MSKRIFCLDIGDTTVSGLLLDSGLRGADIAAAAQVPLEDGSTSQTLAALADRGVGAIGLASVGTPFTLGSGSQGEGRPLGELRATGVWLGEDGSVGTVHEVDLHT